MNKPLLIASTVAAFLFASCDNENTTNPEPLGTVTIKGAVVSDLDEDEDAGDPTLEKVPAGVALYFLDDNTDALLGTTNTTADGYTIDLQIGGPRTIRIVVGDFETDINVYDFNEDDYVKKASVYSDRESFYVNVVKGGTFIQNMEISQPELIDF